MCTANLLKFQNQKDITMLILASDARWIQEHADFDPQSSYWKCKKSGQSIDCTVISRSLHDGPFPLSGNGKVVSVGHLHCPACQPDWRPPPRGSSVKPEELVDDSG